MTQIFASGFGVGAPNLLSLELKGKPLLLRKLSKMIAGSKNGVGVCNQRPEMACTRSAFASAEISMTIPRENLVFHQSDVDKYPALKAMLNDMVQYNAKGLSVSFIMFNTINPRCSGTMNYPCKGGA